MRLKDEQKQSAIVKATIKLVNEIGFAASSVSKIAKEAQVSPATIYIYYKNKEDLLVSTYIFIKQEMGHKWLSDFDSSLPIRDIFHRVWKNMFAFAKQYPHYFEYTEQFANSPYISLVDKTKLDEVFGPLYSIIQRGIEQKIIKDVGFDILGAFLFYPVYTLANNRLCAGFQKRSEDIDTAFTLAWDAIKL